MNIKVIYPLPKRQSKFYRTFRLIMFIIFVVAILSTTIVNLAVGGKAWSIIVIWSIISLWRLLFSLKIVEFSIYSHLSRIAFYLGILLILIDYFLAPGWAKTVLPIVLFAYLLTMFIVYLAMRDKRDRHILSIFILGLFCLISIPYSLDTWPINNWIAFAFSLASLIIFILMIIFNFKEIIYELKIRFKTNRS